MDLWLRTDEKEEAISTLEMIAETASNLVKDTYRWKWVIICTHNALQLFMVLALRQGNGLLALNDKIATQWLRAYREGTKWPVEKLDNFQSLYEKVKSDRMLCYVFSRKFKATSDHNWAVKKLNKLRNEFIHFVPKVWSLELTGLPEICLRCLEVIEFLGWESGNINFYEKVQKRRAISALNKAKKILANIKQKYEEAANKANLADAKSSVTD
ncbi:MAG: hypothetical protein ACTSRG_25465 [Candidatus Helarchaeota archaeon]